MKWTLPLLVCMTAALCQNALAEIPQTISYQGSATDADGNPLDGEHAFTLGIYALPDSAAAPLWQELQDVIVTDGIFNIILGSQNPLDLAFDQQYWLGVAIDGGPELQPRVQLTAVPYALHAQVADAVAGGGDGAWIVNGNDMYAAVSGNVGIGTPTPSEKLHLSGAASVRLQIDADTDNVNEADQPSLVITQDGGTVIGRVGFFDSTNNLAIRNDYENVVITLGTNRNVETNGDLMIGGSTSLYDGNAEVLTVRGRAGDWNVGVSNGATQTDSDFFISKLVSTDGTFHIENNGNIGVGTTTPSGRIDIVGVEDEDFVSFTTSGAERFSLTAHAAGPDYLAIRHTFTNPDTTVAVFRGDGRVGIGTTSPVASLDVRGTAAVEVLEITGGADLSERFEIGSANDVPAPIAGMVVCIDPSRPGKLVVSDRPYDRRVAGVISGAGGVAPGLLMAQGGSRADGDTPVALSGRVYCLADASNGAIEPGDLLTTSSTRGHAMKVNDFARAQGAVLGKAMTSLSNGTGLVLVLVGLQ